MKEAERFAIDLQKSYVLVSTVLRRKRIDPGTESLITSISDTNQSLFQQY